MEKIAEINDVVNSFVWGVPTIALIMLVGLYLTWKLGFLQFAHPGYLFNRTVKKAFAKAKEDDGPPVPGEVTSFQAAMMSVSAIVGSGNIAGVATAIVAGGPGALFWMVVAAFVGMATKFAEITLGVKYREIHKDGTTDGGPMYYIAKGLHCKWLAAVISVCIIFYAIVISGIIDTNTIAAALNERFGVSAVVTGIIFAALTGVCILGGAKRVGQVCAILSPFMGGAYILAGLLIIILHINQFPAAISQIVVAAFTPQGITGGAVGSMFVAMRYGLARGIFSNEAGIGSAAMIHSAATVKHPCEQAVWGPIEVCLGAVILFGFSCLVTYNTYAERGATYLFGEKSRIVVRILWIGIVFIGAISGESIVWDIADTVNGLIIIPNLIALVILSKEVVALKKEYNDPDIVAYEESKKAKKAKKAKVS